MVKYQGQVINRNDGEIVKKTRWYNTWEAAQRAADTKDYAADCYQICVIDKDE